MSFFTLGFEVAKSGMNTAKQHLAIAQHNINNINTPGYSRQLGIQVTQTPIHSFGKIDGLGHGTIGQGSKIQDIQRARNEFIEAQYRNYLHQANYSSHMQSGMGQIEKILNEPSDNSLSSNITSFWNSLSELGSKPADMSARTTFAQAALTFTTQINSMGTKIDNLKNQYKQDLTAIVDKINNITAEVYDLNEKIANLEGIDNPANDLRDMRDNLIDELSKLVDVETYTDENGGTSILAGGKLLVGVNTRREVKIEEDTQNQSFKVVWSSELNTFEMKGGHLKATLDMMNEELTSFESSINGLVTALAARFNEVHTQGFDLNGNQGVDFFVSKDNGPINMHNITINPDILKNEALLAFSNDATVTGGNDNLNNLLAIREEKLVNTANGNTMSLDEYYNYAVTKISTKSAGHQTTFKNLEKSLNAITMEKLSVSGVDLDEETANVMKFQQIYSANVKVLKTVDEMLATLIDMV